MGENQVEVALILLPAAGCKINASHINGLVGSLLAIESGTHGIAVNVEI